MTLQEIGERLLEEFPNRYVCFSIEVHKHTPQEIFGDARPGEVEINVTIYDGPTSTNIECRNLEDGIQKLKEKLSGSLEPNQEIKFAS